MRLAGKVAVVTGGAQGIGRAAVELFVREGARVAVADIKDASEAVEAANSGRADAVVRAGGEAVFRRTDVTEEDDFAGLLEETARRWGGIDVVFNNAGIALARPIAETSLSDFERVMAVNVRSVFLGCKLSLPYLLERGRGSVVNMSSNGGLIGRTGDPVYNASKHAVMGLTKSLALAYAAQNIRFNAICPGPIDTPMIWGDASSPEERAQRLPAVLASCPMARAGTPEEVAHAAVFLASDESSFITGAGLPVDGAKAAGVMTPDRYRLDFTINPG
jgi:NAD(P)-dependent dehydrogenase (short-subunit alcohol dehydrogenase family)